MSMTLAVWHLFLTFGSSVYL